jgi:hypothetical protein
VSPLNLDDKSTEGEPISCLELPPVSPKGTTSSPPATIILNLPVDNVSTLMEITMQAPERSEERVSDREQGMMQRIET